MKQETIEKATQIFEKHWILATGKPLDEQTACHMAYAIEAVKEALESDDKFVEFGTWVQDNYSQNTKQGGIAPLPKGVMRKDFTDDTYAMSDIVKKFKQSQYGSANS